MRLAVELLFIICSSPPPSSTTMLSSLSNIISAPLIIFGDQPKGTQVPVVPNRELKQGAFCVVNPDLWGAGDHRVFNRTMNYTEVCACMILS